LDLRFTIENYNLKHNFMVIERDSFVNSCGVLTHYYYNNKAYSTASKLTLLHGFTSNGASWELQLENLEGKYFIEAFDAIGHGLSDKPLEVEHYSLQTAVSDFLKFREFDWKKTVVLLGYSMGGRTALHIAVNHPEMVEALILESATPGIKDEAERQKRIESDNALADFIEREGIAAFVDYWEKLPLWDSQKRLPPGVLAKQRQQRLKNNPVGLANSLRGAGTGVEPPLHDELHKLTMPVLIIAGELDTKYCAIGREMQALVPHARLEIVPDAGHNVHLERPEIFNKLVLNFLDEVL
jgi:2-succinyl-6-hydroxy-2,4-cyclohexadiene-1-carboxylate synthase